MGKTNNLPRGKVGYREAAAFLGIKRATLYALVAQERIPHFRYGPRFIRFELADLHEWSEKHRVEPVERSEEGFTIDEVLLELGDK